eukprot:TRINITY_DN36911_c0_g3_i1.p1 TRINITY_DN36911_c0_g3~~TRINITY_DN36911_c0_g3_i1.p1  ORF type:complete len:244 (+),score=22.78 TRINITY_DN36911_c0_g3_i1:134-865(+)
MVVAAGNSVVFSCSQRGRAYRLNFKVKENDGDQSFNLVADHMLVFILELLPRCISWDRGHKHSNGESIVTLHYQAPSTAPLKHTVVANLTQPSGMVSTDMVDVVCGSWEPLPAAGPLPAPRSLKRVRFEEAPAEADESAQRLAITTSLISSFAVTYIQSVVIPALDQIRAQAPVVVEHDRHNVREHVLAFHHACAVRACRSHLDDCRQRTQLSEVEWNSLASRVLKEKLVSLCGPILDQWLQH